MDYILDIENLLLEQVNCVNNINTKLEYVIRDSVNITPEYIEVLHKIQDIIKSNKHILNNEQFISMINFIINDSGVFIKNKYE